MNDSAFFRVAIRIFPLLLIVKLLEADLRGLQRGFTQIYLTFMNNYLAIAQIIVAIFLILSILLQKRGEGLGAAFGGGGGFYATRRGLEKKIFWLTIISGIIFIALALLNLIL